MSMLRITGMATGIDINSVVEQLVTASRAPVDKMYQKRQTIQWQMEAYREINRKLQEFRYYISDTFARQATLNAKKVTSSNAAKVTATARADVGNPTFTISQVSSLASAASNYSVQEIENKNGQKGIDTTKSLWSQFGDNSDIFNGTKQRKDTITASKETNEFQLNKAGIDSVTSVKIGNETINIVDPNVWQNDNGNEYIDLDGKGKLYRDGKIVLNNNVAKDTKIEVEYAYKTGSFTMTTFDKDGNPVEQTFEFDGSTTLSQLMNEVNASKLGVNMFYDEHTKKISVTRTATGNFNTDTNRVGGDEILFGKLEGNNFVADSFLSKVLHLKNVDENGNHLNTEKGGENAKFIINGLETERQTNTFTINGVTITLLDKIEAGDPPVTINVTTDTDTIVESVKEFIEKYNEIIDLLNGKLREEKYRDYAPLTDEQKAAMSDKEIELWEQKAKSGLLRNDSILSSALSQMRTALYQKVEGLSQGALDQLAKIGIVTTSNYMDGGKLQLDTLATGPDRLTGEQRLRKAIEEDPEGFFKIFMAGDYDSPQSQQGIARRLINLIDKTIKVNIEERAGNEFRQNHQFTLGRQLNDLNDRISAAEERLAALEARYYKQFNAMDSAVQRANAQLNNLLSMLGQSQTK